MTDYWEGKAKEYTKSEFNLGIARIFCDHVRAVYPEDQNAVVLDFGCGPGLIGLNLIDRYKKVLFCDNSPAMLEVLKENVKPYEEQGKCVVIDSDITKYEGEKADMVLGNMVLHHVEDIPTVLKGLYNATKEGGKVVFVDFLIEDHKDHIHMPVEIPHHGFRAEVITKLFEDAGFRNVEVKHFEALHWGEKIYPRLLLECQK